MQNGNKYVRTDRILFHQIHALNRQLSDKMSFNDMFIGKYH